MGKIVTYKKDEGQNFAQIEYESNERVLISLDTENSTVKIFALNEEWLPTSTLFSLDLTKAVDIFLTKDDWGKDAIILDKVIDSIIDQKSVKEMMTKLESLVSK